MNFLLKIILHLARNFFDEVSNRMANMFADCKESLEDSDSRLVSDIDIDDMCEYKSDFSFVYHLVIHENTQFQGMCDLFSQVEYESFIFKVDNMHNSPNEQGYQFIYDILWHVDPLFHSDHYVGDVPSMHYESQEIYFILSTELIENSDVFGETIEIGILSLPQEDVNEN